MRSEFTVITKSPITVTSPIQWNKDSLHLVWILDTNAEQNIINSYIYLGLVVSLIKASSGSESDTEHYFFTRQMNLSNEGDREMWVYVGMAWAYLPTL